MTTPGREATVYAQDIVTEAFHFALDGNREDAETAIDQMTDAERDELRCACKALLSSLARETP